MNKCLKHLFNKLTQNFKTGIPDLQIKPLDPVLFEKVPLNISGVFDIKGNYYNATLTGLAGVHFTEAKSDLKKYRIDLKVNFKSFEIKGISDTNGRLLFLAYRNYGDFLIFGSECIRKHIMCQSLSLFVNFRWSYFFSKTKVQADPEQRTSLPIVDFFIFGFHTEVLQCSIKGL